MTDLETDIMDTSDPPEDEVIVIKKSWLINGGVALVAFLLGGLAGAWVTGGFDRAEPQAAAPAVEQPVVQQQPTQPPSRLDNVSVDDDPFLGPEDAPVTIIEFSDFRCPYCKRFRDDTLTALLEQYGDQIRFVYRDYPVVGGQQAALAAACAQEQDAYWEYHDGLFVNPQGYSAVDDFVTLAEEIEIADVDQFRECLESSKYDDEVANDSSDARSYGITGTPTFFVNGVRVVGAQPISVFTSIIDEELKK